MACWHSLSVCNLFLPQPGLLYSSAGSGAHNPLELCPAASVTQSAFPIRPGSPGDAGDAGAAGAAGRCGWGGWTSNLTGGLSGGEDAKELKEGGEGRVERLLEVSYGWERS